MSTPSAPSVAQLPQVPGSGRRAREQAANAPYSVFAPTLLQLDNGDTVEIPPHPNLGMLDDERQEAYEDLLFEVDTTYDREPDIYYPEQHLENGRVLPEETKRGALIGPPYRINGERVKPAHTIRVVQAVLGDAEYARLKAGGKDAADVWRIWHEAGERALERQKKDSKSNGSSSTVAPVSR